MPTIRLPHKWTPRPYQLPAWRAWENGVKRLNLIWHRRAGKDDVAMHMAAVGAHIKPANYWHCLPKYEQARKAIWEAVNPHTGKRRIDEAFPLELRARTDNHGMMIEFKSGASWKLVGSDNPDSLVGAPPYGIVFSEWALSNPTSWAYLAPILLENGGWAAFITTPRGRNHAKAMYDMACNEPNWFAQRLTPKETGFSLELIESQRKEYHQLFGRDAGDALIEQEYWCDFDAAVLGSVWGKELSDARKAGRIGEVPYEPELPVHTAWDLGIGDATAIWFWQYVRSEIRVIDFYESHGKAIGHYASHILSKPFRKRGFDWVPHDAKVREIGTGRTRIETMTLEGLKPKGVPDHTLQDGINAARVTLPFVYFNEVTCREGLERLTSYKYEYDEKKQTFKDTPEHDWTSHAADAFRYLCMAWRAEKIPQAKTPVKTQHIYQAMPDGRIVSNMSIKELIELKKRKRERV